MPEFGNIFDDQTKNRLLRMLQEWEAEHRFAGVTQPEHSPPPARGVGVTVRQGKLDGALFVGGTQTVSIWWNSSDHSYINGVDEDSGDNWENCCGPLTQDSEIASGTAVTVRQVGGERLIIGAACP